MHFVNKVLQHFFCNKKIDRSGRDIILSGLWRFALGCSAGRMIYDDRPANNNFGQATRQRSVDHVIGRASGEGVGGTGRAGSAGWAEFGIYPG